MIRIALSSLFVDDQDKALRFYTDVLGFAKKTDLPLGEARWLTVVSAADPDGVQLLLEPNGNPAAKSYQEEIFAQGLPATSFAVDDLQEEYERLRDLGVVFRAEPTDQGGVSAAVFEDTCGNLIQLHEE